jgi:hypothetical protein
MVKRPKLQPERQAADWFCERVDALAWSYGDDTDKAIAREALTYWCCLRTKPCPLCANLPQRKSYSTAPPCESCDDARVVAQDF